MSKTYTNSGKSVRERLLNLSRMEHYNPQMMISRYMQERLLYRLSVSNYRERFILKGGALLYAYGKGINFSRHLFTADLRFIREMRS